MNINYEDQGFNASETVGEVSPEEEYDDYDDNEEDHDISSSPSPPRSPSSFSEKSSCLEEEFFEGYEENPGEWVDMPSMELARYRFASATVNERLYVFGGGTKGQTFNQVELYTPGTRSWISSIPPMATRRSGASAAVVGEDIFIIGGSENSEKQSCSDVEKFNIRTNSFELMPPMKCGRNQHASITIGGKIYVIGGYKRKTCEIFDTETQEWSSMPSPVEERCLCAAVAVGHKIFCIGGISVKKKVECEYDRYLNTMEIFDTTTNTWSLSEATMQNRRAGCSAVTDGSTITVIGGRDEKNDVLAIEEYDIERNVWSPSSSYRSLEEGRSKFAAMMFGSDVIIIGGIRNNSLSHEGVLNSVQICKSSINSPPHICAGIWSSNNISNTKRSTVASSIDEESMAEQNPGEWVDMPSMELARYRFASATVNKKLYMFGGIAKSKRMNQSELYTSDTGLWSSTIPPMETRRSGASTAVVGEGIYIIGGMKGGEKFPSRSCEKFNMRTNTFEAIPPMNTARDQHVSLAIGKKIYVIGGYRCKTCEIFDSETQEWSSMASTTVERCICAAVAVGNKIYCIGGFSIKNSPKAGPKCNRYLNTMEIFDTTTNTWTLSEATMQNRRAGCCAVTDGSTITVIGGRDEKNDILGIEEYDIERNVWRPSQSYCSLEKGRSEFAAMMIGKDVIIIGGIRNMNISRTGVLDSVQICSSSSKSPISEMENDKASNPRKSLRNNKRQTKLKSKAGNTQANKRKATRSIGRKKQKTATDRAAVSSELFGEERFLSFENAKKLKKRRIAGFEEILFGQVRAGSLYDRLVRIEVSVGVQQTLDSLSSERLDSLENSIESKTATIEEHEMDYFGEVKDGPLTERWIKLEEVNE